VDPISIRVEFDGADQATREVGRVTESLEDFERQQQQAVQKSIEFTSRVAAATGAVQSLASAMGTRSDAAGLVSRVAATTAAFTQLGSSLGPMGAAVGAALGIVTAAVEAVTGAQEEAARQAAAHAEQLRATARAADEAAEAMRRYQSASARISRAREGQGAEDQQALLNRALRGQFRDAEEARLAAPLIQEQIGQLRDSPGANREFAQAQIERLQESLRAAEEAVATFERLEGYGNDPATSRQSSGPTRADIEAEAWERYQAALDAALAQQEAAKAVLEEQMALRQQAAAEFEEQEERKRELAAETLRLQVEAEAEALEEQKDKALEAAEQIADANEARLDAAREQVAGYKEVTDVIVGGLTDALASIIDGSRSAESAFLGLLAGFLKFVAEKSALSAAEEAAQAIAAYARYDYASGAQHTAAAVAFGAVAIAAGAGSAAASSAASSAGRASEPERGRNSGGGDRGGGQIVINWNAPTVVAGTRAELGRELQQTIEAGRQRYG
jgi:hypothetical protein